MKTKIKLEILFALLLIVLTACSNIEYSEKETHSDNYNQIVDLLNKQCLALKHESLDELTPLYAFAENTIEYGQLKNAASKKFDQTNTLECDYFIDKIEFKNNKKTAEAYLNIVYTERVEGHSKNFTLSVPNERGNDFIFGKIGGQWKFCPNGKCAGTKTEKYVCPEGELVNGKFECPVLYPSDISLKPLSECLNGLDDPQEILTSNIGPYKLQQKSITLVENSSVTKLTKQYSGDYMKYDDNKRLFSYAFYQAENDEAYIQIKEMFKAYYELFYKFDIEKLDNITEKNKMMQEKIKKENKSINNESFIILSHSLSILNRLDNFSSSYVAINLSGNL